MNVLAYGAGTDSTAIICGWIDRSFQDPYIDPIELILFADTGGERPETYDYIAMMNEWLPKYGMPKITVVKKGGRQETLEENCLRMNMLPSLAYGYKGCSHKFKIQPQEKFCNNYPPTKKVIKSGGKLTKLIGYEFSEKHRWMKAKLEDDKYVYRFPLVEWEYSRDDALSLIRRMGLPLPGKSSCFFCPATKKREIDVMSKDNPDLLRRALILERNAKVSLRTVKGLGRSFSWIEYVAGLPGDESDVPACMYCVDN